MFPVQFIRMFQPLFKLYFLLTITQLVSGNGLSDCTDIFTLENTNIPNQKEGKFTLISDHDLHGIWMRLIFDESQFTLSVNTTDFIVIKEDNANEVLIKNRNFLLKANTPTYIKIELKYKGSKAPKLIEYRLNGKTVCPFDDESNRKIFKGDIKDRYFLENLIHKTETLAITKPSYECGELPSEKEYDGTFAPWHAAIYTLENNKEDYICEGIIITNKHILTAAHCVSYIDEDWEAIEPKRIRIRVSKDSEKIINVKKINLHPGFRVGGLLNDIAIIEFDHMLEIDSFLQPICLPSTDQYLDDNIDKAVLWGYEISNETAFTNKMKKIEIEEIRNIDKCESRPHFEDLSRVIRISDNSYCAAYKIQEPSKIKNCVGDSGAAVASLRNTHFNSKVWTLNSVVTVGLALQNNFECNEASTIVLLDVRNYLRWIAFTISSVN